MSVKGESKWMRLVFVIVVFIGLYIIYVLAASLWDIREAYRRIDSADMRLGQEQDKNQDLIKQLQEATSSAYIEEVARNELNMQKQGERLVILQGNNQSGQAIGQKELDEASVPNWQKWWNLIK